MVGCGYGQQGGGSKLGGVAQVEKFLDEFWLVEGARVREKSFQISAKLEDERDSVEVPGTYGVQLRPIKISGIKMV